jgi:hypothetical protein
MLGENMTASSDLSPLAGMLTDLKQRSGRSYAQLGRSVHLSKSTVHRLCSGAAVPPDFATVERMAQACGATRADLRQLHHLWNDVVLTAGDPGPEPETPVVADPPPAAATAAPATAPRRLLSLFAALTVASMLTLSGSGAVPMPAGGTASTGSTTRLTGPTWSMIPLAVPRTLFGVTVQSSTGTMPSFRVGAVRLWDSATRWSLIEPRRGQFDWTVLDRHVAGAGRAGLPVLFALGGTPAWASPDGPPSPYPDGSRAAPPDDLATWDEFVQAVVHRYHGRIESYELWALGNDRRFFDGTMETLVEMTRRAAMIIRAGDAAARVVCPGMGQLWTPEGQQLMTRFAELGGYRYCDVVSVKLHRRSAADAPESMLQPMKVVDDILHRAGVHPPVWSTGTTYTVTLESKLDDATARNHAVRFYLVGLLGRRENIERMYFYNWGGTKIPLVLQPDGGAPTPAALAVEQLQRWLDHAETASCGQGTPQGLPENAWQCAFTIAGAPRGGADAVTVLWTHDGTADVSAPPGTIAVHRLDGTSAPAHPGDVLELSEEPMLVARRL